AADGALVAMIRHPVTRLNSLFHRVAETRWVGLTTGDVYRSFHEQESALDTTLSIKSNFTLPLSDYVTEFEAACANMISEDAFILHNMEKKDVFQYERIVIDPNYFRICFERLAEKCRHFMSTRTTRRGAFQLECPDSYLDQAFTMGVVNRKNAGPPHADAIVAGWPNLFRQIFSRELERHGGAELADRYAELGYELPKELQRERGGCQRPDAAAGLVSNAAAANAVTPARVELKLNLSSARDLPSPPMTTAADDRDLRLKQMLAVIDHERRSHAEHVRNLQKKIEAERDAFGRRIKELQETLVRERDAFGARTTELHEVLDAERTVFKARLTSLEQVLAAERESRSARIVDLHDTLSSEREMLAETIAELRQSAAAERDASAGRI